MATRWEQQASVLWISICINYHICTGHTVYTDTYLLLLFFFKLFCHSLIGIVCRLFVQAPLTKVLTELCRESPL